MAPTVTALHIYPVKSCRGISLESATISKTGFAYDRFWVIVDAKSGRFLSQRSNQKLALIDVALPPEALVSDWGTLPPDAALCLSTPGAASPLQVPLVKPAAAQGELRAATVWEWKGNGQDEGDTAAEWLEQVLGQPCRLLRYAGVNAPTLEDPSRRALDPKWVDPSTGFETAFSDGFPFLLASTESLADLSSRLPEPGVPMNRFRPNIVVSGLSEPWEEDTWAEFSAGEVSFNAPKPCARCKITTVNQSTGEVGKEPLKELTSLHGKNLGWKKVDKELVGAFFGWNLTTAAVGKIVKVGDPVEVTRRRDRTTLSPIYIN